MICILFLLWNMPECVPVWLTTSDSCLIFSTIEHTPLCGCKGIELLMSCITLWRLMYTAESLTTGVPTGQHDGNSRIFCYLWPWHYVLVSRTTVQSRCSTQRSYLEKWCRWNSRKAKIIWSKWSIPRLFLRKLVVWQLLLTTSWRLAPCRYALLCMTLNVRCFQQYSPPPSFQAFYKILNITV